MIAAIVSIKTPMPVNPKNTAETPNFSMNTEIIAKISTSGNFLVGYVRWNKPVKIRLNTQHMPLPIAAPYSRYCLKRKNLTCMVLNLFLTYVGNISLTMTQNTRPGPAANPAINVAKAMTEIQLRTRDAISMFDNDTIAIHKVDNAIIPEVRSYRAIRIVKYYLYNRTQIGFRPNFSTTLLNTTPIVTTTFHTPITFIIIS
jgi:hypothetical protein